MQFFRRQLSLFVAIPLVGAGILAGYFIHDSPVVLSAKPLRSANSSYKFIHPLIGIDTGNVTFEEFRPLESNMEKAINQAVVNRDVDHVSVYFRDMDNGHWVGINENDEYYPASMFKVPIMIAYLKEAESRPEVLDQKLTFKGGKEDPQIEYTAEATTLEVGKSYSIRSLIELMVVKSDNFAKDMLLENVDPNSFSEILSDLGIQAPANGSYKISAKTFSLFYRTLYGATLLNREMSEKALELLSRTEFTKGIAAGMGPVLVSHKYGERVIYNQNRKTGLELHDCGIIYHPNSPYIMCIMTKGYDLESSLKVIQKLSRLAYDEMSTLAESN